MLCEETTPKEPESSNLQTFSFVKSKRGGDLLIYQNYLYHSRCFKNTKSYWYCVRERENCKANVVLQNKTVILSANTVHYHETEEKRIVGHKFHQDLKEYMRLNPTMSVPKIYSRVLSDWISKQGPISLLPSYETVRSQLYSGRYPDRYRSNSLVPKLPKPCSQVEKDGDWTRNVYGPHQYGSFNMQHNQQGEDSARSVESASNINTSHTTSSIARPGVPTHFIRIKREHIEPSASPPSSSNHTYLDRQTNEAYNETSASWTHSRNPFHMMSNFLEVQLHESEDNRILHPLPTPTPPASNIIISSVTSSTEFPDSTLSQDSGLNTFQRSERLLSQDSGLNTFQRSERLLSKDNGLNTFQRSNERFSEATQSSTNPKSDPLDTVGAYLSTQLRELKGSQLAIAQKLMSDVLFYGKMEKLTEYSTIQLLPNSPP